LSNFSDCIEIMILIVKALISVSGAESEALNHGSRFLAAAVAYSECEKGESGRRKSQWVPGAKSL